MPWQHWIVGIFGLLGMFASIATIGKERDPITPGAAAIITFAQLSLVLLLIWGNQG